MIQLICIVCPKGCRLAVDTGHGCAVTGNACARGREYGKSEVLHPTRIITSTVRIQGAAHRRCPVKLDAVIPKDLIFVAMKALEAVRLHAPVRIGQVVVENVCGTEANFIATRDM